MTPALSRRTVLAGLTLTSLGALTGCTPNGPKTSTPNTWVAPNGPQVTAAETQRATTGTTQRTTLTAAPTTIDLGGVTVDTWAYNNTVPGPVIRATAGDSIHTALHNNLPAPTTIHWHGVRLRNDMDGVPDLTQPAIAPGQEFTYSFTAPDPGAFFFHPHVGLQLDTGLAGVLLIDDPNDPGTTDHEWVVVLDDWLDGVATNNTTLRPDTTLQQLRNTPGGGHMGAGQDITYPHHLINGKTLLDPSTFSGKPGDKVTMRLINAASDTTYRVWLTDHELTITSKDGVPTANHPTSALLISMGERYDVTFTLGDGAFGLLATAEGKQGRAGAYVRSAQGQTPDLTKTPAPRGDIMHALRLTAAPNTPGFTLPQRTPDVTIDVALAAGRGPYTWLINGRAGNHHEPLPVHQGQLVELRMTNHSHAIHPMHLHGHTFRVANTGAWHDTVLLGPMARTTVHFHATNPGMWMLHCHNIYHAEAGMMSVLGYRT